MYQRTILRDIPKFIAAHSKIQAYELEASADDTINFQESLNTIRSNLEEKKMRIRLGIEYLDDALLRKHQKGLTVAQVEKAVAFLNQ